MTTREMIRKNLQKDTQAKDYVCSQCGQIVTPNKCEFTEGGKCLCHECIAGEADILAYSIADFQCDRCDCEDIFDLHFIERDDEISETLCTKCLIKKILSKRYRGE